MQRPQPGLSFLESQKIQEDSMECLGGKEGACTLLACLPAGLPGTHGQCSPQSLWLRSRPRQVLACYTFLGFRPTW